MLNETIKKELLAEIEKVDIDISTLDSARWDRNIYGVEAHLAVGGWDYDEGELWKEQAKKLAEIIKQDGLCNYATLADDEDEDGSMTTEAYLWLLSLAGE